MGFWSFLRDLFVLDWLFGHHKKESGMHNQSDYRHNDYSQNNDNCSSNYGGYHRNDYVQQDFDDDLDSGMFDDDF